jgi:hypothetical protein
MNRKAVKQDESTGHIRKNPREVHKDEIMRAWVEAQTADTSEHADDEWIDWQEIERHVLRLQRQLAHAVEHNNRKAVRHYKWLIRTSHHTKLLAIRHVTQENHGRRTPGVDGETYTTPRERQELAELVNLRLRPLPVRRVYIRKKNGKLRPLGIPSMHDRVCQAIHKSAKQSTVIRLLNPIIRGWANYYSTQVSKKVFGYCDHKITQMLWRWAKRLHPKKGAWVDISEVLHPAWKQKLGLRGWPVHPGHHERCTYHSAHQDTGTTLALSAK